MTVFRLELIVTSESRGGGWGQRSKYIEGDDTVTMAPWESLTQTVLWPTANSDLTHKNRCSHEEATQHLIGHMAFTQHDGVIMSCSMFPRPTLNLEMPLLVSVLLLPETLLSKHSNSAQLLLWTSLKLR